MERAHLQKYVRETESVISAARQVRNALGRDPALVETAVDMLEQAASHHEHQGAQSRRFMFQALEDPALDVAEKETATEDALVEMLMDLEVANVLIAAGAASGEAGPPVEAKGLDEAVLRLENTMQAVQRSEDKAQATGAHGRRFAPDRDARGPRSIRSKDRAAAVNAYQSMAEEALDHIVKEASAVVTGIVADLKKLDSADVISAISELGQKSELLAGFGRLIRQGLDKIQKVIDGLVALLGAGNLKKVREQVGELWSRISEDGAIAGALRFVFGVDGTRRLVEETLRSDGLSHAQLDAASGELLALMDRFGSNMEIAARITKGITVSGSLLALIAVPQVTLVAASAYAMVLGGVVLLGLDYADSGRIFQRTRGVGRITIDLRSANGQTNGSAGR